MSYPTRHTRPRCERLADRTASDPVVVGLFAVCLLALLDPLGPVVGLVALAVSRRLGVL